MGGRPHRRRRPRPDEPAAAAAAVRPRPAHAPTATIVVVCKVGARSAQVTAWLRHQGYDAVNLEGGMLAWAAARRPMRSSDGTPARVA